MDTKTIVITVIVVAVVVVALLLLARMAKRKRAERAALLRERFGPEYDRAVQETGSERKAQSKLAGVAGTRDKLEIRPLDPAQRDRYESDWMSVQAAFVDAPEAAVRDADRLVGAVMRDRGYPVDDFDQKADMVAVDHPHIAENYRAANAIRRRTGDGVGYDTDDLRQAFVHYRALFAELLGDQSSGRHAGDGGTATAGSMNGGSMNGGTNAGMTGGSMADRNGMTGQNGQVDRDNQVDLSSRERTAQEPPQR